MTKAKQELLDMVNGWIKNKELHKLRNKPFIRNNIYMIEGGLGYDNPSQQSIAEELAYKKVGFWGCRDDEEYKLEKKALALADRYYDKMEEPNKAVDFLIKQKVGKNLDELVEDGYIRLDVDEVVWSLQNQKTMQVELKKDDGVDYLEFTSSTGYVYGSKKKK